MKDKLIVVDVETNVFEDQEEDHFDVIQIGAYKLSGLSIVDKFDRFVKPYKNPVLTDFIIDLTKITQEQVDAAGTFSEVWEDFKIWARPYNIMVSWGYYDWKLLKRVATTFGLSFPFSEHINIKEYAQYLMNLSKGKRGLGKVTNMLNLPYDTTKQHNALYDVRMIYNIIKYMTQNRVIGTYYKRDYELAGKKVRVNPSIMKLYNDLAKRRQKLEEYMLGAKEWKKKEK